MHWIDNADSWICPVCGLEVSSPAKYKGCKCPQCGFQDVKDKDVVNKNVLEMEKSTWYSICMV